MPSTYTNDLRLELIAVGEGSGTAPNDWGSKTNVNLTSIASAFGPGTENLASDADATLTLADGAADELRALYLKITSSASLTATRTLTIAPNTVAKVWIIENATTGGQSITISQGTGANVTIGTGAVKMVYTDGAGSGAAVVDALVDLDLTGTTTIAQLNINGSTAVNGVLDEDNMASDSATKLATQQSIKAYVDAQVATADTLAEVLANGNTSGGTGLTMSSGDDLTLTGASYNAVWDSSANALEFADNAKATFGDGDLQIYHNANNSYVQDVGTGKLHITSDGTGVSIDKGTSELMATFDTDGAVTLYHNNAAKLATTSTGADITGILTADGLTVDSGTNLLTRTSSGAEVDVLEVRNNATATSTASTIKFVNSTSAGSNSGSSELVAVRTGTNTGDFKIRTSDSSASMIDRLLIDSSGNVGIGTDPSRNLSVNSGSSSGYIQLVNTASGTGSSNGLELKLDSGGAEADIINRENGRIGFWTNNTERARIDSSGRVGVGTSDPSSGTSTYYDDLVIKNDTSGSGAGITIQSNTTNGFGAVEFRKADGTQVGKMYASSADGLLAFETGGTERMRIDSSGDVNIYGDDNRPLAITSFDTVSTGAGWDLDATSGNGVVTISTGGSERMRIDSSGNVGIGGTPTSYANSQPTLVIEGSTNPAIAWSDTGQAKDWFAVAQGSGLNFSYADGGGSGSASNVTQVLTLDNGGNVGIGTSSPRRQMHIHNSASATVGLQLTNGATGESNDSQGFQLKVGSDSHAELAQMENSDLRIFTNAQERMRIDSSGNVGIGSSAPASFGKFVIQGAGNLLNLNATSGVAYQAFYENGTGRFYLGTLNGSDGIAFIDADGSTERMRIDASGNLLVGTTDATPYNNTSGNGISLGDGLITAAKDGGISAIFNRMTSDGDIVQFRKDGTTVGSIGVPAGTDIMIGSGDTGLRFVDSADAISPCSTDGNQQDNLTDLGRSAFRFDDIYATNGTIQTSDRNEKQDIEELSDAEQRVAAACKGLLRKFRWKSSVADKGDDARIHFGIIAQDLQAAFEAEGLDAGRYAMFISSTWTDEETGEERTRMGVRYSELLAFIISAI